eukprot:scaffold24303_cov137-Cylindrotheca_fusiformis.AAC.3
MEALVSTAPFYLYHLYDSCRQYTNSEATWQLMSFRLFARGINKWLDNTKAGTLETKIKQMKENEDSQQHGKSSESWKIIESKQLSECHDDDCSYSKKQRQRGSLVEDESMRV